MSVCCELCIVHVEVSATSRSKIQRSPIECVCVCVCHWVWSNAKEPLCTYNEQVERGKNKKRRKKGKSSLTAAFFDIRMSVHRNIIPNYSQQVATFLDLFIFTDALHASGGSSAHHQEHITVHTTSGIVSSSIGWQYLKLYVQLCAPDYGRRNRLKHVQHP